MYKISLGKELFEDILLKKIFKIEKQNSKYWKKELIEVKIIDDNISYAIKQIDKLFLSNGLGENKPQMIVECKKVDYSVSNDSFEFFLGKIIEQRNTDVSEDYKDILIEKLLLEKQKLEDSLNKDYLTQVYNRKKMDTDLNSFVNQKNSFLLTAIFIDIDEFKTINNDIGYDGGDKILMFIARKLEEYSKKLNGEVYRYSGKEFLILCFIEKEKLISILNLLKEDIKSYSITLSMGISFYDNSKNKNLLIKKANEALEKAKKSGKDRVEFGI